MNRSTYLAEVRAFVGEVRGADWTKVPQDLLPILPHAKFWGSIGNGDCASRIEEMTAESVREFIRIVESFIPKITAWFISLPKKRRLAAEELWAYQNIVTAHEYATAWLTPFDA